MNKLGSHRKKFKIQRALGLELPGLGKSGALDKRGYPPGQHGRTMRRKPSAYGGQLREKQKLLFHYCIREEQLRRFVRDAQAQQASDWMSSLISLLERRLDNVVFRLSYARSILSARQLVSHGHVLVNGRRQTIGSMVLRVGDRVSLTPDADKFESTQGTRRSPRLDLPSYLMLDTADRGDAGVVTSSPGREHVPFEFNPAMVAEYYAKRGL
jgi:small subunit ribosomal protein S4